MKERLESRRNKGMSGDIEAGEGTMDKQHGGRLQIPNDC